MRRLSVLLLVVLAVCIAGNGVPSAQEIKGPSKSSYLTRPGRFGCGGRLIADKMKDSLGQTVIVENKPGAAAASAQSMPRASPRTAPPCWW